MKIHKKLYKAKKQWCCMALAAGVVMTTAALTPSLKASADANATTDGNSQQVTQVQKSDNNSDTQVLKESNSTVSNSNSDSSKTVADTQTSKSTVNGNVNDASDESTSETSSKVRNEKTTQNAEVVTTQSDNDNQTVTSEPATTQNGWSKTSDGKMVYYQNGKPLSGRQYISLPTIPNTNVNGSTNWYLVDNGVAQSGLQKWYSYY